jgi:hypothetical protein
MCLHQFKVSFLLASKAVPCILDLLVGFLACFRRIAIMGTKNFCWFIGCGLSALFSVSWLIAEMDAF